LAEGLELDCLDQLSDGKLVLLDRVALGVAGEHFPAVIGLLSAGGEYVLHNHSLGVVGVDAKVFGSHRHGLAVDGDSLPGQASRHVLLLSSDKRHGIISLLHVGEGGEAGPVFPGKPVELGLDDRAERHGELVIESDDRGEAIVLIRNLVSSDQVVHLEVVFHDCNIFY